MKSIVISCLCVVLLGAFSLPARAQTPADAIDDATKEAVRREALKRELTQKLEDAIAAERRGAFLESARLYTECLDLVRRIGTGVEQEHKVALSGFTITRMQLAEQAQRTLDFAAADAQYALILKEDPKNEEVKQLRMKNDELRIKFAGRKPSDEALALSGNIFTNRVQAATLAQDGKFLLDAGQYDAAEARFRQALKLDPSNYGADQGLKLALDRKAGIAGAKAENEARKAILEVDTRYSGPHSKELPVPNAEARTNRVQTSKQRQKIYSKLDAIRMDSVKYDNLPLNQVIDSIVKDAKNRDPEKRGLNIISSGTADPAPAAAPQIDPATGLPVAGGVPGADSDIGATTIRIDPAINDISLRHLLDILVKVADRPIKYSVEDWGILFSLRGPETPVLHTRWYKIDPNTFMNGLQGVVALDFGGTSGGLGGGGGGGGRGGGGRGGGGRGGGGGGGFGGGQGGQGQGGSGSAEYASVSIAPSGARRGGQGGFQQGGGAAARAPGATGTGAGAGGQGGGIDFLTQQTTLDLPITIVRAYFAAAGVTLDPPKTVVFNDRLGMLMVRATLSDLDMIEQAVQVLNMIPPQVQIESKMVEIGQDDSRALGFDWILGNTVANNGSIGISGGTAPSYPGRQSLANPSGIFPGPLPAGALPGSTTPAQVLPAATDGTLTAGLRQSAPALATVTGILTDPQFRVVIRALEQRSGANFIASPRIVTPSGRQAQIKTVEVRTIVTELDADQTAAGGGGVLGGTTGGGVGSLILPIAEPFELGPSLDVVPYVSADGYTIQMTLIPTLKTFVGYDFDTAQIFQAQVQSVGGAAAGGPPLLSPTPLPIFRLRQVVTSAIVWDGQTVALGGLISDETMKTKDKVPVIGDLPFVGRFFRSEASITTKKNLVIFVTPTIIDPAGNRVHTDEELPFAQVAIPTQRPAN